MPDLQQVAKKTFKLVEANASLDVMGKKTTCRRLIETVEGVPIPQMTWIDGEGRLSAEHRSESSPRRN